MQHIISKQLKEEHIDFLKNEVTVDELMQVEDLKSPDSNGYILELFKYNGDIIERMWWRL